MGLSIRAHVHYYATYYGYVYRVVRGDSVATWSMACVILPKQAYNNFSLQVYIF